jgi:abhydrolase domain-containing protein 6
MWVSLPWGRLRVHVSGSGPAVLALHGLGGSGRYWEGLSHELGDEATIIAPDLAGFGASDKPHASYDRDFHLDALDKTVEAVGLGRPAIVGGHSMGGVLAALWAARHPDEVRSLALAATPYPKARPQKREWEARGVGPFIHRGLQIAWPVLALLYRSRVYPRAVIADYPRHTRESYWKSGYALLWDPSVVDEVASLRAADQRRLLIYARDDRQVSLSAMQAWAAILPGSSEEVLDSGGHQLLLASHFHPLAEWVRQELEGARR